MRTLFALWLLFTLNAAEAQKVTIQAQNQPVAQVLQDLARQAGVEIRLDAPTARRVTVALTGVELAVALKTICQAAGLTARQEGNTYVLTAAPTPPPAPTFPLAPQLVVKREPKVEGPPAPPGPPLGPPQPLLPFQPPPAQLQGMLVHEGFILLVWGNVLYKIDLETLEVWQALDLMEAERQFRNYQRLAREARLLKARRMVEEAPDSPKARRVLAKALERTGRPREAAGEWEAYLRLAPEAPNADWVRAKIELLRQMPEPAPGGQ